MNTLSLGFLAIGLYALGTSYQLLTYLRKKHQTTLLPLLLGACALIVHLDISYSSAVNGNHVNFGLMNSLSLVSCISVALVIPLSTRLPTQALLLISYPLAIASIIGMFFYNQESISYPIKNKGIFLHISFSILAYSLLMLAAFQAFLVVMQNRQLKSRKQNRLMRNFPPLLTMERVLIELIWGGTILLAGAILLGFVFVDDIFAQHLAHKTFFSIAALLIFTTLLAGRQIYGWRGSLAGGLTLWGATLLMLGFLGSKFVIEFFLN